MIKHDIELPVSVSDLLLEKHAKFLLSYATDKDEYVSTIVFVLFTLFLFVTMYMIKDRCRQYNY